MTDPNDETKKATIQADNKSVAVGSIAVGGSTGDINIHAGDIGYSVEEVSVLLTQITSTFQPKTFDGRCPYKGLDVFDEEDAELFFGREKLVEDLVSRVKHSRTVFVTGPSGSGKSSLVRAGLIPTLKQGGIKNSERWLYGTMKPGRDPIGEVARVASGLAGSTNAEDEIRAKAMTDRTIFTRWCEIALKDSREKRAVIFIDQFEEAFTQINNEAERVAFLNLLTHAAMVENGRVIILFSMRSDFVSNCATYPQINALLNQQFMQIGAMQPEELVSAIAQPALRVGLRIDPDLIAQIINEMKGEPGALPLMQFALKDLFDSQQEKSGVIALTLNDYLQRGGIHKALERHADDSFSKLSKNEQELARSIFSGLIEIGRGTQDTRRTALFDELIPANTNEIEVEAIVQKLADARLITTDEQAGKDTITISHEKLIDAWPWLKKLVNENREVIALQNEINSDAKEWEEHKRDFSYLYTGARLLNADEQVKKQNLNLNHLAKEFVKASQVRKRRSQGLLYSGISVVLIVSILASVLFRNQAQANIEIAQAAETAQAEAITQKEIAEANAEEAQRQANLALARQLADIAQSLYTKQGNLQMIATLISIQSMKLSPTNVAASFILNNNLSAQNVTTMFHDDFVLAVAFSRDGTRIVSGSQDGTARVWDAATGQEIVRMAHADFVIEVAFSPDGTRIISGSWDGTARVWDATTGHEIARMTHNSKVTDVVFSPDGTRIVSSSEDGIARVWDASTSQEIAHMTHDYEVSTVAFSPDGTRVISGSQDGTARVWDATTGKEILRMTHVNYGIDSPVDAIAFSPNGKFIATSSANDVVRVWDASTGQEIANMTHELNTEVAFSPNNTTFASGGWDNTVRVWDALTGQEIARMTHDGPIFDLAFSPDGKTIASGSGDGTARVWDISTGQEIVRMTHTSPISSLAFSPDGKSIISGSWDNTVRVWDASTSQGIVRVTQNVDVSAVALSLDRRTIVLGDEDGIVRVWDVATGQEIARMIHESGVTAIALSPDGRIVVSSGLYRSGKIWDASTGQEIANMTHDFNIIGSTITRLAFSPDGRTIISEGQDNTVRIWDAITGKEITRMIHDGDVYDVDISPDGKTIVSVSQDGTARVWDAITGQEIARMTHDNVVNNVAFNPNGTTIVSTSWDGVIQVWNAATGQEIARMTHDSVVTDVDFSLDGKTIVSSSWDNTARVWDVTTGHEIARMTHDAYVYDVDISPDGKTIVSGGQDLTIRVWDATTGREIVRMTQTNDGGTSAISSDVLDVFFSSDGMTITSIIKNGSMRTWTWQPQLLVKEACQLMPRNLVEWEWELYIGDILPYQAVCENLPVESDVTTTPTATP